MMQPLVEGLYVLPAPFQGVGLFLYVIHDDNETILIDSGLSTTPAEHILPALEQAGMQLDMVLCTHGHVDHFGGNAALREHFPGLKTAIHHLDVSWAEDHERHLHEMYLCMPQTWQFEDGGKEHIALCGPNCAIDSHLETGQVLKLGAFTFKVLHAPGHCPGQIALHDEEHHIVICGDVALGKGGKPASGAMIPSYYYDPTQYIASQEMILTLAANLYCTGHHGALDYSGMQQLVEDSKNFVASLDLFSLEALDNHEPHSLREVVSFVSMHLPQYEKEFHLHASVQAHLLRHCQEGRARAVMTDNLKHYLAT